MRRAGVLLLAGVVLVLGLLSARMLLGARSQLQLADAARGRGDLGAEVQHLLRAMAFYLPGNPWGRSAKERLARSARDAEAERPTAALRRWIALRGAILSLRGATRPFSKDLPEIERRIAALASRQPRASAELKTAEGRRRLRSRLAKPEEPAPGWTALGLLGFLCWTGGGFGLLFAGVTSAAATRARRFWPLLGLVLLGLALFALGMARA